MSTLIPIEDPFAAEDAAEAAINVISSADAPEAASAASEAALAPDKPEMKEPDPGLVELPGGWVSPTGVVHKQAFVKELTGRDEERMARVDATTNLPLYLQTMVECGTESIGGEPATKDMLRDLLVGDREMLILGIRMATYGRTTEPFDIVCPKCQFQEKISLELDKDIPVKHMERPEVREYEVDLRNGSVALVQPLTARQQDEIWDVKKTVAELKTATLERCVVSIDGRPVNHPMVLNLGMADRNTLLDRLAELQPGPDYGGVRLDCQGCGESFSLTLDLADLFRT
jgi:hypothetical protein